MDLSFCACVQTLEYFIKHMLPLGHFNKRLVSNSIARSKLGNGGGDPSHRVRAEWLRERRQQALDHRLSNLDILVARAHTPTTYFYRPDGERRLLLTQDDSEGGAGQGVEVHFYPLAGRLGVDPDSGVQIECTGEGYCSLWRAPESVADEFRGVRAFRRELQRPLVPSGAVRNASSLHSCHASVF
ncbi:hypothetical protein J5N97_027600 [Dioscorea zingiberensis]|uniref:Uncharacterized protein n=1 Tax=Dioscorea zingiberensis TaxID=325984 RepID=A0A9D5C5L4_9LILI|nr:hypothetical protein J5N97_027600 [Dioscorea zingiberensis]